MATGTSPRRYLNTIGQAWQIRTPPKLRPSRRDKGPALRGHEAPAVNECLHVRDPAVNRG